MGFEWLPGVLAVLRGVEPYEVMQVLMAARRWPRPVIGPAGVALVTVWGRTSAGRLLIVVVRRSGGFDWWIVGAREMNAAEAVEHERWEASDEH